MSGALGAAPGDRHAWLLLGGALLSSTVVVLPNIMLGALAVLVRRDLRFGEAALGAVFAVFAVAATATSAPGGRLSDRIGAARTMTVGAGLSAVALAGIALSARSWTTLAAWMVIGGIGNGLAQPASNGVLSAVVNPARQGVAFGVKQAAIPLAAVLSGLALPLVGLVVGWRWAFAAGALLAVAVAVIVPRAGAAVRRRPPAERVAVDGESRVPLGPLLLITAAVWMASMTANAVGAFYVESAVAGGVTVARAGIWLVFGGVCGIAARTAWGWLADRRDGRHLVFVAALMMSGAGGPALLALRPAGGVVLAAATMLAYGAAWGWPGLFNYAIVRQSRSAPAAATGITQTGVFAGVLVGPPLFGILVETRSYAVAWSVFGVISLLGAGLLILGRRRLLHARERTPT